MQFYNRFCHSVIWIFTCILVQLSGQDVDIQIDPEEINSVQSQMENQEVSEIEKNTGHFRLRINPEADSDRWHHRGWVDRGQWQLGYRLDKYAESENWEITRYAFNTTINSIQINIGHLRQELGQGLVFGNSFGKTKSSSQPFSVFSSQQKISYSLGAVIDSPMIGLSVTAPFFNISHTGIVSSFGNEKIFSYTSIKNTPNTKVGIVASGKVNDSSLVKKSSSVFFIMDSPSGSLSGEYAHDGQHGSTVLNFYQKNSNLRWGVHYRYYPIGWSQIFGEPYSVLHGGSNETGLMGIIRYRYRETIFTSWLELFRELENENGYPVDRGRDWMIRIDTPVRSSGTLSFQVREKEHRTVQNFIMNGLVREVQSRLTRTQVMLTWTSSSPVWKVQWQKLLLKPEIDQNESGQLLAIYSPEIKMNNLKVKTGTVIFSSDSWNSRLYTWSPGLNGEFRFPVFYETGIEIFSKWNYELTTQTNVSFRHSYTWKNDTNLRANNILFQFESTF